MAMRNFWVKLKIDGRERVLEGGPTSKDGGFELTVYVNDGGESVRAVRVVGSADDAGNLTIVADREAPFRRTHDDPMLVVYANRATPFNNDAWPPLAEVGA